VLSDREDLDSRVGELDAQHAGSDVPRPLHWGGYRLVPDTYEFWQHRDDRLHDRLRYQREGRGWKLQRLAP
jgi:pyridoxamine 5'-phosphate oxidase